jgi:spermidine/putrescine transport system substrate-binding protein
MAMFKKNIFHLVLIFILFGFLMSCANATQSPVSVEIIYRDWEGVMPQSVLDDFTKETGVHVVYLPYQSQEEAVAEMKSGKIYDVVVLESQLIPPLVADGTLSEIDYKNVSNFKNISANFRDLVYDPGNRHSVPYSWGMTGLIVATDRVSKPIVRWADLWEVRPEDKIVGWPLPRYMIGMTLKSLGYSINSTDPRELEEALVRLIELKPHLVMLDWEPAITATTIIDNKAVTGLGQSDDIRKAREQNVNMAYVFPAEGAILWGDNYTIPSVSTQKDNAEKFINFLLRADIAARIITETYYWLPNDAAMSLLTEDLRNDEAIFPLQEDIRNAEIILSLDAEGEKLYAGIWQRFMDAQR